MPSNGVSGRVRTVVVVVEDERLGEAIAQALRAHGYAALAFRTAHRAFHAAAPLPPDAWIIDAALPAMTGREIVRLLRTSSRPELSRARLIGLSGDPDARAAFVEAGADDFVTTPLTAERLVAALERDAAASAETAG